MGILILLLVFNVCLASQANTITCLKSTASSFFSNGVYTFLLIADSIQKFAELCGRSETFEQVFGHRQKKPSEEDGKMIVS